MNNEGLLEQLSRSFEESARIEEKGLSLSSILPEEIILDPAYAYFKNCASYSGTKDIIDFLQPRKSQKYLDFGSYLNLERYQLHHYPWHYFGLEASNEIVKRMQNYIQQQQIVNATILLSNGLDLAFEDSYFDRITCIGVLEYYPLQDAKILVNELCRVLKKRGKMILDIPNIKHDAFALLCRMEAFFGRELRLKISSEDLLALIPQTIFCHAMDPSQVMLRFYFEKKS